LLSATTRYRPSNVFSSLAFRSPFVSPQALLTLLSSEQAIAKSRSDGDTDTAIRELSRLRQWQRLTAA
jgi:hypothetical protein